MTEAKVQKTYRVIEAAPSGLIDDERTGVYVDATNGDRVLLETGTQFTATLEEVTVWDRRMGLAPVEVKTGRWRVAASDIDVRPGSLDSLVTSGRAVDVAIEPKPVKKKPAPKKKR